MFVNSSFCFLFPWIHMFMSLTILFRVLAGFQCQFECSKNILRLKRSKQFVTNNLRWARREENSVDGLNAKQFPSGSLKASRTFFCEASSVIQEQSSWMSLIDFFNVSGKKVWAAKSRNKHNKSDFTSQLPGRYKFSSICISIASLLFFFLFF